MTMEVEHAPGPVISRSRLEMLVDGVFAIAMTILVLELKVPDVGVRPSVAELARSLAQQGPTFLSYLLSFFVLGLFWYRHNRQFRQYRAITRPMLALHFVQLAAAASFPFCAALVGRYVSNPLSLVVYLGCVVVYAWSATAIWMLAKRSGSLSGDVTESTYVRERRRGIVSSLVVSALLLLNLGRVASPSATAATGASADDKAIRDLSVRWQKALLDRDADVQASMFAADGVSYHDGQEPLVGPAAIRAWESRSKTSHPKAVIASTTDAILIARSGDLAVQTGEGRLTNLGENGEDRKVHRQRFVTVWKKANGEWKVAHDIAVNVTPWE